MRKKKYIQRIQLGLASMLLLTSVTGGGLIIPILAETVEEETVGVVTEGESKAELKATKSTTASKMGVVDFRFRTNPVPAQGTVDGYITVSSEHFAYGANLDFENENGDVVSIYFSNFRKVGENLYESYGFGYTTGEPGTTYEFIGGEMDDVYRAKTAINPSELNNSFKVDIEKDVTAPVIEKVEFSKEEYQTLEETVYSITVSEETGLYDAYLIIEWEDGTENRLYARQFEKVGDKYVARGSDKTSKVGTYTVKEIVVIDSGRNETRSADSTFRKTIKSTENSDVVGPKISEVSGESLVVDGIEAYEITVKGTDASNDMDVRLEFDVFDEKGHFIYENSLYIQSFTETESGILVASQRITEHPGYTYAFTGGTAEDVYGNQSDIDKKILPADFTFSKQAGKKDTTAPEMIDIKLDKKVYNATDEVEVTVVMKDQSPVAYAHLMFTSTGQDYHGFTLDRDDFTWDEELEAYVGVGTIQLSPKLAGRHLTLFYTETGDIYNNHGGYTKDITDPDFNKHPFDVVIEVREEGQIRHEGRSREGVAINVAKEHFADAKKAILVNREKFPDAISATNISQGEVPVLYTRAGYVDDETLALLKDMDLDEIYVLGGTLSVSDTVMDQLKKEVGTTVTRVAGRSRYDANVEAIRESYSKKEHVVLASGEVFADALYGVSYANTINSPVVLVKRNTLEASTMELLKDLGVKEVTIIGGKLSVTDEVEAQLKELGIKINRIAGRSRYIGSAEVATASYANPESVVIASGDGFSDALVSAPIAQKLNAPILLVQQNKIDDSVKKYLEEKAGSIENVYIQGGPLTISPTTERTIKDLTK